MMPTQNPTCTGIRVRSTLDANVLFHAVATGILPMVDRRLDAADRAALRPGCVYVWEERGPASDENGVGMERFTEGRHWHPSRVRDDFLLYLERESPSDTPTATIERSTRSRGRSTSSTSSHGSPIFSFSTRPPPQLIKQTYSAWVNGRRGLRKWHMNAYYTEDSMNYLRTVDDDPLLAKLSVPHERYRRARTSKGRDACPPRTSRRSSIDEGAVSADPVYVNTRSYAPYPSPHQIESHTHQNAQDSFPLRASTTLSVEYAPDHTSASSPFQLVPLDRLQDYHIAPRRERIDDEVLRSFRLP